MNAYYAADMDRESTLNLQDEHDALVDYHRDLAAEGCLDGCHPQCGYKDCFGACTKWQRWPDCQFVRDANTFPVAT